MHDERTDPDGRGMAALKARHDDLDRQRDRMMVDDMRMRTELRVLERALSEAENLRGRLETALATQTRRADCAEKIARHMTRPQVPVPLDPAGAAGLAALLDCAPTQDVHALEGSAARAEALERVLCGDLSASVVMPTFERAPTIVRAVRSALEQTVGLHEIVVADDGSSDDTLELLRAQFPAEIATGRLVLLACGRGGVCAARNAGIEAASGPVLAFLDSDNHWHPDHLLWALAAMEVRKADCVYTGTRVHHLSENWTRIDCAPYDRAAILRQNIIDLNCFAFRRAGERGAKRFDTALTRLVDWDYILQVTGETAPLRVPVATVEYFLDAEGLGNISLTSPLQKNARRIQLKHRDEMRAHGILNAGAEAALDAFAAAEAAPAIRPAPPPAPAPPDAGAGSAVDALPYFGGLNLFVVLPDNTAPPADLPLGLLRPRFVRLLGAGRWCELDSAGDPVRVHDHLAAGNYWYPDLHQGMPSAHQLATLVAAVQFTEIDMALASLSLDAPPAVSVRCLRNQTVLRARAIEDFAFGRRLRDTLRGKVLRLPQGPAEGARTADLGALLGRAVAFHESSGYFALGAECGLPTLRPQAPATSLPPRPGRRRVLVLAQKLAVGGVERNTVEISRALAPDHDCLYLTLEQVRAEQGSLCHQAVEATAGVLDLAEIAHHGLYPDLLRLLVDVYAPETLWICNGSMWLSAEAGQLREIFDAAGIVDQQVYDTQEGWIKRYREPGIQSFDRFIAINRKIRSRFVDDMGMDPDRVDLIYSAINAGRFRDARAAGHDRDAQRDVYGLPRGKTILAFMGRLVDQKRPLDFLELAGLCRDRDDLHFVLTGNGLRAPRVEAALEAGGLGNVTWIRNVADTTTFWPALDGYVVTSEYEGLPIALIEAIAMGVPALSTDVGDIRHVLETYGAGHTVEGTGAAAFVRALDPFLADLPEMRARLSGRGEEIIDFFSAETISRQFAESFARASARRGTAGGE